MSGEYKKVNYPITVPSSKFCWEFGGAPYSICSHFDNEGGHPQCSLGFFIDDTHCNKDPKGVNKAKECLNLKEVNSESI